MSEPYTYRDAGVDIDAGNKLVERLKKIVPMTHRTGVLGNLGGFGGCFELSSHAYRQPVLVASTDGVGTKLRLAIDLQQYDTIGIDLVAMCANDLVVMGAEPLFFLDYYATGQLDIDAAEKVITGIAKGCQQAHVALIGGETAEMPGMYAKQDFDLAGFCVGIVEKEEVINGSTIVPGDILIALASSGPHSNGYSLIRHILNTKKIPLDYQLAGGESLASALLAPTRIYVKSVLALANGKCLKGAAHITGGGFIDNIPRILPDNCAVQIDERSWDIPPVFRWLQEEGKLSPFELYRTFNCGVGMVLAVAEEDLSQALALLQAHKENAWVIGQVIPQIQSQERVVFANGK